MYNFTPWHNIVNYFFGFLMCYVNPLRALVTINYL